VSCFTARVEEVKAPEIAQTAGSIPTGFAHRDALPRREEIHKNKD